MTDLLEFPELENLQALRKEARGYEETIAALTTLSKQEPSPPAFVPFTSVAFVPGRIVHPYEVLCFVGDDYFLKKSIPGAIELLERRRAIAKQLIQQSEMQIEQHFRQAGVLGFPVHDARAKEYHSLQPQPQPKPVPHQHQHPQQKTGERHHGSVREISEGVFEISEPYDGPPIVKPMHRDDFDEEDGEGDSRESISGDEDENAYYAEASQAWVQRTRELALEQQEEQQEEEHEVVEDREHGSGMAAQPAPPRRVQERNEAASTTAASAVQDRQSAGKPKTVVPTPAAIANVMEMNVDFDALSMSSFMAPQHPAPGTETSGQRKSKFAQERNKP
eukprot:ANDGO_00422.mRNA.1 hypothetical protein CAOG_06514